MQILKNSVKTETTQACIPCFPGAASSNKGWWFGRTCQFINGEGDFCCFWMEWLS